MADQPLALRSDGDLEAALRAFGESVAWPEATSTGGGDVAAAVRARIESSPRTVAPARPRWSWWPARRALVAAVLILLVLAAIVGAATLGLPGLRLILGPAPVSPPPSLAPRTSPTAGASGASAAAGAPGSTMNLGQLVPLDRLDAQAGFDVAWPQDPALGPPDAAYIDPTLGGQVALVWRSRDGLPDTLEPGVGLVVTAFRGTTDSGFYSKSVGSGTKVKSVLVDGHAGVLAGRRPALPVLRGTGRVHPRPASLGRRRPALDSRPDHVSPRDVARRGGCDPPRGIDARGTVTRPAVYGECAERIRHRVHHHRRRPSIMSPHDHPTRTSRMVLAIAAAIAVAACSGKAPPTNSPSDRPAAATTRPAPTVTVAIPHEAAEDGWLVTGRSGDDGLQDPGEHGRTALGAPERCRRRHLESSGQRRQRPGTSTTIRDLRLPESKSSSQTIDGTWRLPTVGLDPTPVGVSDDGRTIVLVEDETVPPRAVALRDRRPDCRRDASDRRAARGVRIRRAVAGWLDPVRRRASRRAARRPLPGPRRRHRDGRLRDGAVADKNEGDEAMAGWPIAQARRPDGMVFTLYHGAEHPFIHALSSVDAWALCIDLPATGADDTDARPLTGD